MRAGGGVSSAHDREPRLVQLGRSRLASALRLGAIQLLKAIGPADLPRFASVVDRWERVPVRGRLRLARGVPRRVRAGVARVARRLERADRQGRTVGGRGAGTQSDLRRARDREIALAVVLVIGAGLLVRSYSQLASANAGFDPQRMVTLVLNVTGRLDVSNPRIDPERQCVVYDGTGMVGVARFYRSSSAASRRCPVSPSAGATSAAPLNQGLFPVVLRPIRWPGATPTSPISSRTATRFRPSSSRRSAFGRSPAGCSSRPIGATRPGRRGQSNVRTRVSRRGKPRRQPYRARRRRMRPGQIGFGQLGEQTVNEAEIVGVIPDIKQGTLEDAVQPPSTCRRSRRRCARWPSSCVPRTTIPLP